MKFVLVSLSGKKATFSTNGTRPPSAALVERLLRHEVTLGAPCTSTLVVHGNPLRRVDVFAPMAEQGVTDGARLHAILRPWDRHGRGGGRCELCARPELRDPSVPPRFAKAAVAKDGDCMFAATAKALNHLRGRDEEAATKEALRDLAAEMVDALDDGGAAVARAVLEIDDRVEEVGLGRSEGRSSTDQHEDDRAFCRETVRTPGRWGTGVELSLLAHALGAMGARIVVHRKSSPTDGDGWAWTEHAVDVPEGSEPALFSVHVLHSEEDRHYDALTQRDA